MSGFPEPPARGAWRFFTFSETNFLPPVRQDDLPGHRRPWWLAYQSRRSRLLFPRLSRSGPIFTFDSRQHVITQPPCFRTIFLAIVGLGGSGIQVNVSSRSFLEFGVFNDNFDCLPRHYSLNTKAIPVLHGVVRRRHYLRALATRTSSLGPRFSPLS
ncbi:hypothetical protein GALMADRAFT_1124854 [Galerina marginata CBS 339.88]|uniref:Uncharacterized protein n=1 Tax=Galerina marginata (strain CBS 339.88) TaxID=685588 RepID=A0A067TDG0_GALM3|nr:hypothetical protein GALMADRAFT_1124854 [Galerina marginata CBS 339.88]